MSEKVKKAINSLAKSTLQEDDAVTVNGFRSLLSENGFEFTDSEFKTIKPLVKAAFAKLNCPPSSDVEILVPKRIAKPSKRYDNMAKKNLDMFTAAMSGSSRLLPAPEEDEEFEDEDEQAMEESEEEEASESEEEIELKKPTKKITSKKRASTTSKVDTSASFKSAAMIDSDDDESNEVAEKKVEKKKKRAASEDGEVKSKAKARKVVEKKTTPEKASTSTAPKLVKGTVEEEAKIKKLKELLTASGNSRPFTVKTGSEKTMSVTERVDLLTSLLKKGGLQFGKNGSLPSLSGAKEIGEKVALEKEMQSIAGAPKLKGLRDGKVLKQTDSDLIEAENAAPTRRAPAKKFGEFLGDQSDSD